MPVGLVPGPLHQGRGQGRRPQVPAGPGPGPAGVLGWVVLGWVVLGWVVVEDLLLCRLHRRTTRFQNQEPRRGSVRF